MPRFKLVIEYAGTRYSGWQAQKNARTVQGELRSAIGLVTRKQEIELYGSGRTDAGVHALGQVAHLDVETAKAAEPLRLAINDELPPDIHVLSLERARPRFHARHDAVGRSYLYQISRRRTAFGKPYVWWVKEDLDAARMRRAAMLFRGMNVFGSFTDQSPEDGSTRVLLQEVTLAESGALILARLRGSHFLWKMVRRIVGVLVEVGKGKLDEGSVETFLATRSHVPATLTAPPSGLFLERVFYQGEATDYPLVPVLSVSAFGPSREVRRQRSRGRALARDSQRLS
jgi:tRNA pseudouridine38-40 synthase